MGLIYGLIYVLIYGSRLSTKLTCYPATFQPLFFLILPGFDGPPTSSPDLSPLDIWDHAGAHLGWRCSRGCEAGNVDCQWWSISVRNKGVPRIRCVESSYFHVCSIRLQFGGSSHIFSETQLVEGPNRMSPVISDVGSWSPCETAALPPQCGNSDMGFESGRGAPYDWKKKFTQGYFHVIYLSTSRDRTCFDFSVRTLKSKGCRRMSDLWSWLLASSILSILKGTRLESWMSFYPHLGWWFGCAYIIIIYIYIVWLLKLPTSGWSILCPTNFLVLEMSQQIFLSIHQLRVTACPWQSCNRWLFHNTKRLWSKRPPVSSGWWL